MLEDNRVSNIVDYLDELIKNIDFDNFKPKILINQSSGTKIQHGKMILNENINKQQIFEYLTHPFYKDNISLIEQLIYIYDNPEICSSNILHIMYYTGVADHSALFYLRLFDYIESENITQIEVEKRTHIQNALLFILNKGITKSYRNKQLIKKRNIFLAKFENMKLNSKTFDDLKLNKILFRENVDLTFLGIDFRKNEKSYCANENVKNGISSLLETRTETY